ncbi:MarR family transcriptional regulator [Dictyobacter alpinus]|uniref:MarR family transcriptional regulator n=2 Tax=Dictyobacter alpinus TaxID=2014873 RepID=A0A402BFG0_9CHLR|nr:MarR family transcriptional regulator [Dictyobacter alpinus]
MNTRNENPEINYQALAELRYQIRRFLRFSEQVARLEGIEPQQYQLLLALKGLPEDRRPTVRELAERLQLQHNSTVELINRLVEHDLVERHRDDIDQRQVIITLTARGEEILQRQALHHQTELATIGPALLQSLETILSNHPVMPDIDTNQQGDKS